MDVATENTLLDDLFSTCDGGLAAADEILAAARQALAANVSHDGKVNAALLEAEQFSAHGFAWLTTYVEGLRNMLDWGRRLEEEGKLGELESLMVQAAFGEYLNQICGGIAISQVEVARLSDIGIENENLHDLCNDGMSTLMQAGNTNAVRMRIGELIADCRFGEVALGDETLELIRDQFRRFVDEQVLPDAHEWHLKDEFIPMPVVEQMSELGVFGLTVPEKWGGLGLGKTAMCLVTEELSRGYIGVGSLGTRSEIAAELIGRSVWNSLSIVSVFVSKRRLYVSLLDVTKSVMSHANWMSVISFLWCPSTTAFCVPVFGSHTRTVVSSLAEKIVSLSGPHSAFEHLPVCPFIVRSHAHVAVFQTLSVLSADPLTSTSPTCCSAQT